jgi:clan AA aspartic protease
MFTGVVNAILEATIRFPIHDSTGQQVDVQANVDTGFNMCLTLPLNVIMSLGLVWVSRRTAILADGSTHHWETYEATVLWDGTLRNIELYAVDADSLVGMKLLEGYELRAEIKVGGLVTIEALP